MLITVRIPIHHTHAQSKFQTRVRTDTETHTHLNHGFRAVAFLFPFREICACEFSLSISSSSNVRQTTCATWLSLHALRTLSHNRGRGVRKERTITDVRKEEVSWVVQSRFCLRAFHYQHGPFAERVRNEVSSADVGSVLNMLRIFQFLFLF